MAKKRLNKKVALTGLVIFVLLVLGAIGIILRLTGDPEKFTKDGDAALQQKNYEVAERNYLRARARADSDELRVKILFKLADMYITTDRWRDVRACWNRIIRIEPNNIKARFSQLKYFYTVAKSSGKFWEEVASQASELIDIAESENLLDEDIAKWDSFKTEEKEPAGQHLGPYLYLARGRAVVERVKQGELTDVDKSLGEALQDLEKVRKLEPTNIDAYWYMAQAAKTKGEILSSRGSFGEKEKGAKQAITYLEQAVKVAPDNPRANINLLSMKFMVAEKDQILSLEPDYIALVKKFPSNAQVYSALAQYYQLLDPISHLKAKDIDKAKNLDKAIEAIEKALELDNKNVSYAIAAANLHYRKFSIYKYRPSLDRALEIATEALDKPGAQDKPGPESWKHKLNRVSLCTFLANCYIEQILESRSAAVEASGQVEQWMAKAEELVHQIEQLSGSGEDPQTLKWRGMLELAKGNKEEAIRKLYTAYEQIKAAGGEDAELSYRLAKIFWNTPEIGAVAEFLSSALNAKVNIIWTKPEAHLDYVEIVLKHRDWSVAISNIDVFEENFGPTERSRRLRVQAYIGAKQLDKAEEELANWPPDEPETLKLKTALVQAKIGQLVRTMAQRQSKSPSEVISPASSEPGKENKEPQGETESLAAELDGYRAAEIKLLKKLLAVEPNAVSEAVLTAACNDCASRGKVSVARELVDKYLEHFPSSVTIRVYKRMLSEPDPANISESRRAEIEQQALSELTDPIQRAVNLGTIYKNDGQLDKAAEQFKKVVEPVLEKASAQGAEAEGVKEITPPEHLAIGQLYDIALQTKDWKLADKIAELARRRNLDNCEGNFFAARLAIAKEQYKDALTRLNECLKQRPIFSRAYMWRSNVNAALKNDSAALEDAKKAASLNPMDGNIANVLASVLYRRNKKLGSNASSNQIIEVRQALERAIALNSGNVKLQLLSLYAEYISSTEPMRALAIRQGLQKAAPSMQNAMLLGNLALNMARGDPNAERQEALFDIAGSAFEQARQMNPEDETMLYKYAEYYRARGQEEKAQQLLLQSQNRQVLWIHYYQNGQFEKAKEVLEQLYNSQPKDKSTVKGLLLVGEKTGDKEAVKKYSQELLSLDDTAENRLIQIQAFLNVGLVKEAEHRLESLSEKYPNEPMAMLLESRLKMRQGQLEKALECANKCLEKDPENAKAWQVRGEIDFQRGDYSQAIIDLQKSKSSAPEPVTRVLLAKAYWYAARAEDAITELKSTLTMPGAPPEGRLLLEQIYIGLDRKDALAKFYDEMLQKFPDSVFWHNHAAAFALSQKQFDKSGQLYKIAWQQSQKQGQGNSQALDGYLQALVLAQQLDKVIEEGGKYIDGNFASIALYRMAEAKMKLGDKTAAVEYCRQALDKAGTNDAYLSQVVQKMYSLLGAAEIQKYCSQKLQENPQSLIANLAMFNLAKIKGEYNKALEYIDKSLQLIGADSPQKVDYLLKKAIVLQLAYGKTSDKDYLIRAIAQYKILLNEVPNHPAILNNLAYMLAENDENLAEALDYAERAWRARPNNPSFLDTYAYVLYKNGRYSQAEAHLQAALQQYELLQKRRPDETVLPSDVYEHLGMIKEKLGASDQALAAYRKALETGAEKASDKARERIEKAIERLSHKTDNR